MAQQGYCQCEFQAKKWAPIIDTQALEQMCLTWST